MGACICQRPEFGLSDFDSQMYRKPIARSDLHYSTERISDQATACGTLKIRGDISDYYKLTEIIGKGAYGVVWRAAHMQTGAPRAVKVVRKSNSQEIKFLQLLSHPNVIKLCEVVEDAEHVYIITELCTGRSLFSVIGHPVDETSAADYMSQIISGVLHCHSMNIVHRDIKPENILFKSAKSSLLKLIDFGASTSATPQIFRVGTCLYMAPETFSGYSGPKCDVWSCGVILYILITGEPPFQSSNNQELYKKIKKEPCRFDQSVWDTVSSEAKDLVKGMLEKDPLRRLSTEQVYAHPWLKKQSRGIPQSKSMQKGDNNGLI